ncbi:apolipoprotein A-Ib [Lampris incognitus]|uniref:apolipoprotein A-Ib n=1 Tax=Lampris incognitus TaxID=2546036 RepID=UPI0024B485D7|nr:apolipoprotein A-Ib [Lampris incognitus]
MKFVALALALLLAVGSQAASLQADASSPSELEHVRSVVGIYLGQVKQSALRLLNHLDGTEYEAYKSKLSGRLDDLQNQLQTAQAVAAPYTDAVFTQMKDATAAVRESIMADFESLRKELEPQRTKLREVVDGHIVEYRKKLEPIYTEYSESHRQEIERLRSKVEPMMDELRAKVAQNVEETKNALMPMVETVRAKVTERLEVLRGEVAPYMTEYKDHLTGVFNQLKNEGGNLDIETIKTEMAPRMTALKEKADILVEEVKTQLLAMYESISANFNKN